MSNLTIIESGLVPVYKGENGQIVNARELHEFLESKQDFTDWIKGRIGKYGFIEDEDFTIILGKSTGGRPSTDYMLTINTGKEIAMVENNEQGRKVRKYFIEVESRSRKPSKHKSNVPNEAQMLRAKALHIKAVEGQARLMKEIASEFQSKLSGEAVQLLLGGITELLMGRPLLPMPTIDKTYTATEIGAALGVTSIKIGKLANANNLKTDEYGITVLDKSPYSAKQIPSFRYNEKGRERLIELLGEAE